MGLEMTESSSSGASSPPEEDVVLPDAPAEVQDAADNAPSTPATRDEPMTNGQAAAAVNLDNLFDGDDDDEEFPTSSASNMPSSPPSQPTSSVEPTSSAPTEKYSDPNIMLQFYARLFPFRTLFYWLNHGPKPCPDFANREFAFTLSNDAYLRYQSYPSSDLLRKDILKLNPSRFEIGPVYTTNPRDRKTLRKSSAFKPLSKEIVFDIDLTDYDDVRTCCSGADICPKCWPFACMAIKVVDVALRDDFGFEHIMWVYSGRRGVHAWISDKDARELDDEKRKALTGYFEVVKGNAQSGKRVNVRRPLHPHLTRSLEILKPYFQSTVLEDQDPFASQAGQDRLLQLLPDKILCDALRKKWQSSPDRPSVRKWADIDALAAAGVSKTLDTKTLMEAKQDILLEYTYPRLDVEVGKKRIHLLKSPFVVHPGTGRVCVPITGDAGAKGGQDVDDFDPFEVPRVTELLHEIDEYSRKEKEEIKEEGVENGYVQEGATMRKIQDWEKTSLKPFVETFERFVRGMVRSEQVHVKREREEDGMEF